MLRIFLIIAVVGGLAAGVCLYFTYTKFHQTIDERNDFQQKWNNETKLYTDSQAALKKTQTELGETKTKLTKTEADLTAANGRVSDLEGQNKDLSANLTKTKSDLDDAQSQLDKWRQIGVTPEQVKGIIDDLAKTKKQRDDYIAENKIISHDRDTWKDRYQAIVGANEQVVEPPGLKGRILDVDPKFGFVVLDIGSDNGVLPRGDLMVANNGRLVGKVRVISVEKNRSIANILPNWTRGEISEDCSVID